MNPIIRLTMEVHHCEYHQFISDLVVMVHDA